MSSVTLWGSSSSPARLSLRVLAPETRHSAARANAAVCGAAGVLGRPPDVATIVRVHSHEPCWSLWVGPEGVRHTWDALAQLLLFCAWSFCMAG